MYLRIRKDTKILDYGWEEFVQRRGNLWPKVGSLWSFTSKHHHLVNNYPKNVISLASHFIFICWFSKNDTKYAIMLNRHNRLVVTWRWFYLTSCGRILEVEASFCICSCPFKRATWPPLLLFLLYFSSIGCQSFSHIQWCQHPTIYA